MQYGAMYIFDTILICMDAILICMKTKANFEGRDKMK